MRRSPWLTLRQILGFGLFCVYVGYEAVQLVQGRSSWALHLPLIAFGSLYYYARVAEVRVVIEEGRHWPNLGGLFLALLKVGCFGERRLQVKFSASAATYVGNDSWNKLLGRTRGFINGPRTGSTRIGWRNRAMRDGITMVWFTEEDENWFDNDPSEWDVEPLTECQANTYRWLPWGGSRSDRLWQRGWPLPPYFGGREPAPQRVTITLR